MDRFSCGGRVFYTSPLDIVHWWYSLNANEQGTWAAAIVPRLGYSSRSVTAVSEGL
ncbi:hypothetical protein ACVWWJ_003445 [Luteibacter sp. HA06]